MEYGIGSEVLGGWRITRVIGEGASGRVFEVEKSGFGIAAKSALKAVRVPPSPSMAKSMLAEGMDQASVIGYFRGVVDDFAQEIALVSGLTHPGLVVYQDHDIRPHDDGISYDVLLRMELLEPLTNRMEAGFLPQEEVVRLGIEVADALAYCHAHKVIHRDIKPGNIFLDQDGRFKIGDFGVSRTVEQTMGSFSHKGTEAYMAPEFFKGEAYGADVDVYALGLVLYQLLNKNRLPFLPPAPQPISFHDREQAKSRRLSGETLPQLPDCDANLFAVIAAACSPNNAQRPTAAGLRDQLEGLQPQAERIRATHGHADAEMSPEEDRTITGGPIRQPATGTPGSSAGPDAKGTETPGTSDGSSGAAQGPSAGEAEQPEPSRPARDDASEPAPPITETVGIWDSFGDSMPANVQEPPKKAASRPMSHTADASRPRPNTAASQHAFPRSPIQRPKPNGDMAMTIFATPKQISAGRSVTIPNATGGVVQTSLPKDLRNGQSMRFKGQGPFAPSGSYGDLYVDFRTTGGPNAAPAAKGPNPIIEGKIKRVPFDASRFIQAYLKLHGKPEPDTTLHNFNIRASEMPVDKEAAERFGRFRGATMNSGDLTEKHVRRIRKNFDIAPDEAVLLAFSLDNVLPLPFKAGIIFTSRGIYIHPTKGEFLAVTAGELRFIPYRSLPGKKVSITDSKSKEFRILCLDGQSFKCYPHLANWMKGLVATMKQAIARGEG